MIIVSVLDFKIRTKTAKIKTMRRLHTAQGASEPRSCVAMETSQISYGTKIHSTDHTEIC